MRFYEYQFFLGKKKWVTLSARLQQPTHEAYGNIWDFTFFYSEALKTSHLHYVYKITIIFYNMQVFWQENL